MSSYLDFEGVYDSQKRYIVFNWSEENFTQHFGQEASYNDNNVVMTKPAYDLTIKAGEMREMGHFEALTCTKHFVNREILKTAEGKEGKEKERIEMSAGNKDVRKPFEDKTLQELVPGAESPFMKEMRETIRKEEIAKLNKKEEKAEKVEVKKEDKKEEKKTKEFAE